MSIVGKYVLKQPVKYLQLIVVLATGLLWASICMPAYLIELKQGTRFITNEYWKDGNQIKFYRHGGIVGVDKHQIKRITEAKSDNIAEEQDPADQEDAQESVKKNAVIKQETESVSEPDPKRNAILEEKRYLTSEIKSLIAAIKKAKEKDDKKLIQEQRKRLLSLHVELQDLRDTVEKANGGKIPAWWNTNGSPNPLQ